MNHPAGGIGSRIDDDDDEHTTGKQVSDKSHSSKGEEHSPKRGNGDSGNGENGARTSNGKSKKMDQSKGIPSIVGVCIKKYFSKYTNLKFSMLEILVLVTVSNLLATTSFR